MRSGLLESVLSYASYRALLGAFANLLKAIFLLRHVCLFVRPPAWNNSAPTGRISMKFDI